MDCIRKIVLSVVFSLGIISCRTTGDVEKHMAYDKGFTLSNSKFTLSHGELSKNGGDYAEYGKPTIESGSPSNILDGNFFTNIHYKNYSQNRRYVYENFYLTPKYPVQTLRLKITSDHLLRVIYIKKDGSSVTLSTSSNIDTTFNIFSDISQIQIIAVKDYKNSSYSNPLNVYFYAVDIEVYQSSDLREYDGNSVITFADSLNNDTKLKYKTKNNETRSVLLVDTTSPIASTFRIYTSDGVKALGKYN